MILIRHYVIYMIAEYADNNKFIYFTYDGRMNTNLKLNASKSSHTTFNLLLIWLPTTFSLNNTFIAKLETIKNL